jgi:CHASE2 domain-containing sensor protein
MRYFLNQYLPMLTTVVLALLKAFSFIYVSWIWVFAPIVAQIIVLFGCLVYMITVTNKDEDSF